jgi:integrase
MNPLRHALGDYLAVRRALGFKLHKPEKLLAQFVTDMEQRGETHLRLSTMLAWATQPADAHQSWLSYRLSVVRGFASHVHALDPASEVPPGDLLPWRRCRATPYVYADDELAAVMEAAASLQTPHRILTYRTLIGLLAVTGMRVGEAIALDRQDIDMAEHVITVRLTKFGKSRELPVHSSTVEALRHYVGDRHRPAAATRTAAVFVSTAGTRLLYPNVQWTFHRLARRAGLRPRSSACRPRLHDLRHRFAICTMLDVTGRGTMPGFGSPCCRPTSDTSIPRPPTGISQRRRSCCNSPVIASSVVAEVHRECARPDAASVFYRPTHPATASQ